MQTSANMLISVGEFVLCFQLNDYFLSQDPERGERNLNKYGKNIHLLKLFYIVI